MKAKKIIKTIVGFILIFTALTLLQVDMTFSLQSASVVAGIYIIALISSILISLKFIIIKRKIKSTIFPIITILSLLLSTYVSIKINHKKIQASEEIANRLIISLEEYKNTKGDYPQYLTEVTSELIEKTPAPTVGFMNKQEFKYFKPEKKTNFILSFPCNAGMINRYNSDLKKWILDD